MSTETERARGLREWLVRQAHSGRATLEAAGWLEEANGTWSKPGTPHQGMHMVDALELAREMRP